MNIRKKIIVSALSSLLTLLGCSESDEPQQADNTVQDYDLNETTLAAAGYSKIYEEDFSTDLSHWQIWEGGAYNEELQLYQKQNLIVSNGVLEIKAVKQKVKGAVLPGSSEFADYDYTSGRIESDFSIGPSDANPKIRVSARIKLPEAYGMWSAFWSYGKPWPTHGEIDILEATGDKNSYITNYYYGSQADISVTNNDLTSEEIYSDKDLTSGYHVYELIWTKTSLTFLLDGKVMETKIATQPGQEYIPAMFGKSQNVILNLAVGGGMFNNLDSAKIQPSSMYIDWVKVFRSGL